MDELLKEQLLEKRIHVRNKIAHLEKGIAGLQASLAVAKREAEELTNALGKPMASQNPFTKPAQPWLKP